MRKATLLLVLAISLFLLPGCGNKAQTGATIGAAIGGIAGGLIPQAFGGNVSPILQAAGPLGGAVLGGGAGYLIGSKMEESDQQAPQQMMQIQSMQNYQQQQAQQAQLPQQTIPNNVRLSVPATVVLSNNQGATVGSGAELANMLMRIHPSAQFGMLVRKENAQALTNDMAGNGYMAIGAPRPHGQCLLLTFQKSNVKSAPTVMSLAQAAKLL